MTDREYLAMEKSTIVRSSKDSRLLPLVRAAHRVLSAVAPALAARRAARLFTTPPRVRRPSAEIDLLATACARPMQVAGRRVETYTWGVLPDGPGGDEGLVEGLAAELAWTRDRLVELGAEEVR